MVTGAGSGIGRASVLEFYKAGANVVASDVNEEALLETVSLTGDGVIPFVCDTSDPIQVEALMEACCNFFGHLDICFANAGIVGNPLPFYDLEPQDYETVFKVNVIGVFNCFKYASIKMMAQGDKGGSLIATASVAGVRSGAGDSAYSASKAAVISLCKTVANQLTGTNIRCNAICPGLIETEMTKIVFDMADQRGRRSKIGQLNPLLRYGNPSEIASVAVFLAGDGSSYINGQPINVCGGLTSSHPVARRVKGQVSM